MHRVWLSIRDQIIIIQFPSKHHLIKTSLNWAIGEQAHISSAYVCYIYNNFQYISYTFYHVYATCSYNELCHTLWCCVIGVDWGLEQKWNKNKGSMDLGALLDTCNWCDKWPFSAGLFHSNIWPSSFIRYKDSKSEWPWIWPFKVTQDHMW